MSAHTPGPWKEHDRSIWAGEILLAKVYKQGDQGVSNARLIAAAPQLLEALDDVSRAYQDMFDVMPVAFQTYINIVDAAIRAARGGQG